MAVKRMAAGDFFVEAKERFGGDRMKWRFVCPVCGTVQSAEDLVRVGVEKSKVGSVIGFSCIGRFDVSVGCDWTLGGLLELHRLEVVAENGKVFRRFELAEV